MQGYSPIRLEVVMVEKLKQWQKENRTGQIAHVYAKLVNENPEFPLYFVLFAPASTRIAPGAVLPVPLSGIRITLGEDVLSVPAPFSFELDNKAKKL